MLDMIEGSRRKGQQRMRWLDSIISSVDTNLSKLQETVEDRGAWHAAVHGLQRVGQDLATERQLMTYMKVLVAQSCPTFHDPMNCSPSGSPANGILQARILEWIAISFSRGSSWLRDRTQISHTAGRFTTIWATKEAQDIDLHTEHLSKAVLSSGNIMWTTYKCKIF